MKLPKGCFFFHDHNRILEKDINHNRPYDQCNISCERVVRHGHIVRMFPRLFRKSYWKVLSTTTYEMAGDYKHTYMGGRIWAETDLTGLEWHFYTEKDAEHFLINGSQE